MGIPLRRRAHKIRRQDNIHWKAGHVDGGAAFTAGKKAVPAMDPAAREYSRQFGMSMVDLKAYNDYLSGWNTGWHQANAHAKVERDLEKHVQG